MVIIKTNAKECLTTLIKEAKIKSTYLKYIY